MTSLQQSTVTFNQIRGGRFSANISAVAAQQFAEAIAALPSTSFAGQDPDRQRSEQVAMQTRVTSGHAISLGDVMAVLRFRPLFENLGPAAARALGEMDAYVRGRNEEHSKRAVPLNNPLFPPVVIPPKPARPTE